VTPRVSVVTIFLNAGALLEEAIDSVRGQTFPSWELVLVDDGSSDDSTTIARRAAAEDPDRIRYVEHAGHENRGMSASLNLGVATARGELVAFLDADDVFLPDKLQVQVAHLDAHPDAGMVFGPMTYWYSWTGDAADRDRDHVFPMGQIAVGEVIRPPALFLAFVRVEATTPGMCSVLVRRSLVEELGGFEDEFVGPYSDQVLFYKIALRASVLTIDRPTDLYRQHDASTTSRTPRGQQEQWAARLLTWVEAWARGGPHADLVAREVRRIRRSRSWTSRAVRRARRARRGLARRFRRGRR